MAICFVVVKDSRYKTVLSAFDPFLVCFAKVTSIPSYRVRPHDLIKNSGDSMSFDLDNKDGTVMPTQVKKLHHYSGRSLRRILATRLKSIWPLRLRNFHSLLQN